MSRWMLEFLFPMIGLACSLSADPITYTISGTLSGALNGVSFTDAAVMFTVRGDSAGITGTSTFLTNPALSTKFALAGFGTGQFTENMVAFANPEPFMPFPGTTFAYAGILTADLSRGINFVSPSFIGWDLASSLGPISASVNFTGGPFATTLGILDLAASNLGKTVTFQVTALPEPRRWDVVHFTSFSPPTFTAGGHASALANDGSMITVTGTGTFTSGESDELTGGGTWVTQAPGGATTGSGTYQVTGFIKFDEASGSIPSPPVVDLIGPPLTRALGSCPSASATRTGAEGCSWSPAT
jgi:hypothetical protein